MTCPWCDGVTDEDRWPLCHGCGFDLIYHYHELLRKGILTKEFIFYSMDNDE